MFSLSHLTSPRLEGAGDAAEISVIICACCDLVEVDDLGGVGTARHQQQPRIIARP